MIVIGASSIALAAEDPVNKKSDRNEMLNYLDFVFTGVFAIEMTVKVGEVAQILGRGQCFHIHFTHLSGFFSVRYENDSTLVHYSDI